MAKNKKIKKNPTKRKLELKENQNKPKNKSHIGKGYRIGAIVIVAIIIIGLIVTYVIR